LLLFRTGSILVDKAFSLFAKDGLKGATAPRAVYRPILWPPGIPAVEIAEFHASLLTISQKAKRHAFPSFRRRPESRDTQQF
jgi:hypothetical protein